MKNKYKTLIISCWVVLLIYFVIKLLGGNYFDIEVNWKNFINICDFFDKYPLLSCFIKAPVYSISSYLIYLTITKQKFKDDWWMMIILFVQPFCKRYISPLGLLIDGLTLIIIPFIKLFINKKEKWYFAILRVLIGNVLLILFQMISIFTRNMGYYIPLANNTLIGIILSIDYYIMIILYYLHTRQYFQRKEV